MTKIHSSQIMGVGFPSLFDQLKSLNTSANIVDIEYKYNEGGDVISETLWDMSDNTKPVQLKHIEYTYDENGAVVKETVHTGSDVYEKEYVYVNSAVTRERVRKVTV